MAKRNVDELPDFSAGEEDQETAGSSSGGMGEGARPATAAALQRARTAEKSPWVNLRRR